MNEAPPLRRNKRFQVLWVGSAASDLGSAMTALALPLLILGVTGSPALAGIASTCQIASWVLLGLPAGVWVDRLDRRRIMATCEALRLAMFGAFAVVVLRDAVAFWQIVVLAVVHGGANAFFRPAHAAAIQAMVPTSQLPSAYAQDQARGHVGTTVGPPLGGFLFTLGHGFPYLVDAASYLVSLVCVLAARVPRRPVSADPHGEPPTGVDSTKKNMRADIVEAGRWLNQNHGLRAVLILAVVGNVLTSAVLVPVIVLVTERGGNAVTTGGVVTGLGVGGLLGSLAAARIGRLLPAGKLTIVAHIAMGLAICATTVPLAPWWPVAPLTLAWLIVPSLNVVLSTLIGQLTPSAMMGRVNSLVQTAAIGLAPIGPLLGGFLAAAWGGSGALLTVGGALCLASTVAMASRALRQLDGRTHEQHPSLPTTATTS